MIGYVKISYKTKRTNESLKRCIMYIGKYYGKDDSNLYKSGKVFLAKKVKGASRTSINRMVYPKNIKNSEMKQWLFKKRSYEKAYRYIIFIMLQSSVHRDEALNLLQSLYMELRGTDANIEKILSNILVPEQVDALSFAKNKYQYEGYQDEIQKILETYNNCNNIYKYYLK
jgi:hypothetical protein